MNENDLNNFEEFEKKQLVIKITGAVQESNLAEFEERAISVLSSIKMELETDEDFAEAEHNTKSCKLIEQRIAQARQDAIMQTADIAALIKTTSRLEDKFKTVRLALEKKVVSEKEIRKSEIINSGRNHLQGLVLYSPVKHGFSIDNKALTEASKGKRSLAKLREAVLEVVEEETLRLANMEAYFAANIETIDASEAEYPGLYPDKKTLALSPSEVVASQVSARVATFRFETAEKERKVKEAIAEKEIIASVQDVHFPPPEKEESITQKFPEAPKFVAPPPPDFHIDAAPCECKDPFTESPLTTIQFNHHAFASDEKYKIDVAYKIGEVLEYVNKVRDIDMTRRIISLSGLSNYVSYK